MNSIARIGIKLMGIYIFVLALQAIHVSIGVMSAYQPMINLISDVGAKPTNPWVPLWVFAISFVLCIVFVSYLLIFRDEFILKVMRFPTEETSTSIDVHGAVVVGMVLIGIYCFIAGASEFTTWFLNVCNLGMLDQLSAQQMSDLSTYLGLVGPITKLFIAFFLIFFPNAIERKLYQWRTKKIPEKD